MSKRIAKRKTKTKRVPAARRRAVSKPSAKAAAQIDERKKRARRIIAELQKLYPDADCALQHRSALQLLIATILSAQSTDVTVNRVTPALFARFPSTEELAEADPAQVETLIHATGFFRQKTKSVIGACRAIVSDFQGRVPQTIEDLIRLPGVARKTANVVLGTWFGKNEGMVVDTHVGRLATRLGLTWSGKNEKDAVKIEQDLMQVLPRETWTYVGHALIWHGRRVCSARKPECGACTLRKLCPSADSLGEPSRRETSTGLKTKTPGVSAEGD